MRTGLFQTISALLFTSAILSAPVSAQNSAPPANPGPDAATTPASPTTTSPPRHIGGGVTPPKVIYQVDPEFSDQARAAGVGGEVLVNLIVDSHGVPQNVHVLRGVGMGLDETAVDAVKQYRFEPAMEGDKPVAVQLSVVVNFQIFRSPTVIHSVPLHYSSEARKNKASGDILVGLTVDEKGLPQNVHILRGFGMGMDEQAVAAVQRYKFKPFTQGGKPVARPATLQINFDAAN